MDAADRNGNRAGIRRAVSERVRSTPTMDGAAADDCAGVAASRSDRSRLTDANHAHRREAIVGRPVTELPAVVAAPAFDLAAGYDRAAVIDAGCDGRCTGDACNVRRDH